jgi:ligand-binding sensor domain-containing protein/two-component sensor histidine kinase
MWVSSMCIIVCGQVPSFNFVHISTEQGLSARTVTDIAQDANGLIWVATIDGINRLDGYRIKQYFNTNEDKNDFFNSDESVINTHDRSKLWFFAPRGLARYDYKKHNITYIDTARKTKLSTRQYVSLFWHKNSMYVFGNKLWYQVQQDKVKEFAYQQDLTKVDILQHAFCHKPIKVIADKYDNLWAINKDYLLKISSKTLKITGSLKITDANGLGRPSDIDIVDDNIYISSNGKGLLQYSMAKGTIKQIASAGKICKDAMLYTTGKKQYLIVAASPANLVLDLQNLQSSVIENIPSAKKVFVDNNRNIWFGTNEGIYASKPENKFIKNIDLRKCISTNYPSEQIVIIHIYKDKELNIASTANGAGMLVFDRDWNFIARKKNYGNNESNKLLNNIRHIYNEDNIKWIATDQGLVKCDNQYKILKTFLPNNANSIADVKKVFNKIIPITKQQLLIKSSGELYIFNTATEQFEKSFFPTKDKNNKFPNTFIGTCVLKGNTIFLATDTGLYQLNLTQGDIGAIKLPIANQAVLSAIEHTDTLWLATFNGLVSYDIKRKKAINYTPKDGLLANNITHVIRDKTGVIWMTTTMGLWAFDTKTKTFSNFNTQDGLVDNVLDFAFAMPNDSTLAIAQLDQISLVNTKILASKENNIPVILTEVLVNGTQALWQENLQNKIVQCNHTQNNLTLHFTIKDAQINSLPYYYYCINKVWTQSNSGEITLSNLAPGTYTIELASAPRTHNNNEKIIVLIKAPFYSTWWFYILSGIIISALVFALIKYRANAIRQQAEVKTQYELKLQNLEMQSLRSQMNPHFIFNTLNSIKSFIILNHTDLASEYLTKFSKLMRNILDHSKQETITLQKELQTLQIYLELESVRLEHKFDYSIIVDKSIEQDVAQVPSLIIQPFVENALWHGLRNKKEQGHIQINVKPSEANQLNITIEDDGIGRQAAAALKKDQVQHKSYGIEITNTRIQLLNAQNTIITTDLYDRNKKPAGTKVNITLNNF